MPGFLLTQNSLVLCNHGGQAKPLAPFPRVKVMGAAVVTLTSPFAVSGCANPTPPANVGPCVTGQCLKPATRVLAGGVPVLLDDTKGVCVPTGTGFIVQALQVKVKGQ